MHDRRSKFSLVVQTHLWLATLIVSAISVASAEPVPATPRVIGLLLPPEEPEANSIRQGVLLAVEDANRQPGPAMTLVIRGRTGPWGADATEAAQLVNGNGARGLIAPSDGTASHLVLQVAGRTAVPVVTLCSDSSVTRTGVPWVARVTPRTTDEARTLFAGLLAPGTRRPRWSALVPDGRAGRETARDLTAAANAVGCQLNKTIEVGAGSLDLSIAKKLLTETRPDAILLWLDTRRSAELARALRAAGFAGTLAGHGRLASKEFVKQAGAAAENLVVPVLADACGQPVRRRFEAAFNQCYGSEAEPTAALAYDAATLLIGLLSNSEGEPAHRAFPVATSLHGATGLLAFDQHGNRLVTLHLATWRGGCWVELTGATNLEPH